MPTILHDRRVLATVAALAALAVAAALVPRPPISAVRGWAESMGPAFVVVFFLTQAVLTIAPVPRTVFTLSAGLLFGPAAGVTVTIAATTVSAVLALLLVRTLGRTAVQARLTHPAVKAIDARLARRGWLAVGSLRLIAPAPFALVNYCSGLSAVRLLPYTAATMVGILPGTVAVVLLGDALTGQTNPALMVVTAVCVTAGVAGLLIDTRLPVSRTAGRSTATQASTSSSTAPSSLSAEHSSPVLKW
ncbi:TVP38/TMEM64 family protein [Rhodococcus sp. MSC1_016]|uniref:TVP38/TMEM64 family protein n=1 Tax=Rhodococcus sp. MSC1_016 TaxID=2909266 RepID=UPI002030AF2D|nr:TVP38/TMEM64 family protein [Rhodococcus sp. MSC1_016]